MSTDLAVREDAPPTAHLPVNMEHYQVLKAQAKHLLESGFCPKGVTTPQQVLYICIKGRELGFTDVYSLSNISIVNGRPVLGAEAMLNLVYRHFGGNAIRVRESTRERCIVEYRRPEWDSPSVEEWTIEDAKGASLLGKDNWKNYPKTMLRWRAISAACKLGFPDVVGGVYTPEEMGAEVHIDPNGELVIESTALPSEAPAIEASRTVDYETGEIIDHEPAVPEDAPDPAVVDELRRELRNLCRKISQAEGMSSVDVENAVAIRTGLSGRADIAVLTDTGLLNQAIAIARWKVETGAWG